MKPGILIIFCLLLAGAASGATTGTALVKQPLNPAAVGIAIPTAPVTFDSSMAGATVYLDGKLAGSDEAHSKTPIKDKSVAAGNHTVMFRLSGYKDYNTTFHVDAGKSQTVYAQLERLPAAGIQRAIVITTTPKIQQAVILPIAAGTTGTSPPPTTTQGIVPCTKDSTCMIEADAVDQFGAGNYMQQSVNPCGYKQVTPSGKTMTKYCFAKKPEPQKIVIAKTLVAVKNPESLEPVIPKPPVEPAEPMMEGSPASGPVTFIDSFLGLFGGLFGSSSPKPPITLKPPTGTVFDPDLIHPVSSYRVAPFIRQGATVYIGEEGLNVTQALFDITPISGPHLAGTPPVPAYTRIGWFSADPYSTSPTRTVDLGASGRYRSMTVSPADFVGYTGTWYLLNYEGNAPVNDDAVIFTVRDPSLDLSVTNAATGASVSGATVHAGDQLRFSIPKNIGVAGTMAILREPLTNSVNDGFMDIVVIAPGARTLSQLDTMTDGTPGVTSLSRPCWNLPPDSTCNPDYTWNTGATWSNGTAKYPPGTYSVQVISRLNNMHTNYRQAGALYEGKTASHKVSFTLV